MPRAMCKLKVIILSAKSSVTFVWAVSQSRRGPRSHSSNNRTGPETTEDVVEFTIHVLYVLISPLQQTTK